MALGQWSLPLAAMVGTQVTLNSYKSGGQCDFLGQPLGQKPRSTDIVSTLWPQAGSFLPSASGGATDPGPGHQGPSQLCGAMHPTQARGCMWSSTKDVKSHK